MSPSKVTIAIPTLNRANYLRLSLASALAQTYDNLEVVVSSNACTDDTDTLLDSIRDPRVRVLKQKTTLAMMENFNACLRAASGKYFLLLSDDDMLEPPAIEEMVKVYTDGNRCPIPVGFVYCNGAVIDRDGKTIGYGKEGPPLECARDLICAFFAGKRTPWPCSILFRREDMLPGYDESYSLMADAALWIRVIAAYGSARYVNQKLVRYRLHCNASVRSRVGQWHKVNSETSEFAIEELRKRGENNELARTIRKSVRRANMEITPYYINLAYRSNKGKGIREYWTYRGMFASFRGIGVLTSGLALLLLPNAIRHWLRRCFSSIGLLPR